MISDVHAHIGAADDDKAPSHCSVSEQSPLNNPLVGLNKLIDDEKLYADLLLTPGDLGDRANPQAVQYAWKELHSLRVKLQATDVIATTGNHDVDSRYAYNNYDAKGMLQSLAPKYPFDSEELNDRYWSRHFVIISKPGYRLVVLNSSAFHGEGKVDDHDKRNEHERGRISRYTLNRLQAELDGQSSPPINLLLCHHHPHPHTELNLGGSDLMEGGQQLIDLIGSGKYGDWMVIHGHKHHPKLGLAAGEGNSAPIVFAAGSLAGVLFKDLASHVRNQFYILEFPTVELAEFGLVGNFRSWDFFANQGWKPALQTSRLPGRGGFGWRGKVPNLASKVVSKIRKSRPTDWDELVGVIPELKYLLPHDQNSLCNQLRSTPGIVLSSDDVFPPKTVWRKS